MAYYDPMCMFFFLPVLMLIYHFTGRRARRIILLLANIVFFMLFSRQYVFWLGIVIAVIYTAGISMDRVDNSSRWSEKSKKEQRHIKSKYKKLILAAGVIISFGILVVLKYSGFLVDIFNDLAGTSYALPSFVVPIGISFYTLQAVSYMADVCSGTIKADRNFLRVALYMSFFPQIMEGPIARYDDTARDLYAAEPIKARNLAFGVQRFMWGMFKKFVIADRLAPAVSEIFNNYQAYSGGTIALGAVMYTLQLYCDFSGCIEMALGIGEMFGINLPENFRQPFFSKTASEFWRRWHISLGNWLKDYIFYPVSLAKPLKKASKSTKKILGKHLSAMIPVVVALFCVWTVNGFWHGSGYKYLFFGLYYFVIIALSTILEPAFKKLRGLLHIDLAMTGYKIFQHIRTLIIVFIGEMFFNAVDLDAGFGMFRSVFTDFSFSEIADGTLLTIGMDLADYVIVIIAAVVLLVVGILHEMNIHIRAGVAKMKTAFRWIFYYIGFFAVTIFGAYGAGYTIVDMIYAGF